MKIILQNSNLVFKSLKDTNVPQFNSYTNVFTYNPSYGIASLRENFEGYHAVSFKVESDKTYKVKSVIYKNSGGNKVSQAIINITEITEQTTSDRPFQTVDNTNMTSSWADVEFEFTAVQDGYLYINVRDTGVEKIDYYVREVM